MNFPSPHANPNVICLGLSVYDMTWHVPTLPASPGKSRAHAHHQGGGGNAANAAVTIAKLGGSSQLWARSGNDVMGRQMVTELEALHVDARHVRLYDNHRASVSAVFVDSCGERMIVNYKDPNLPEDCDWLPWEDVALADAVLADPRWIPAVERLFLAAKTADKPRILDGEPSEPVVFDTLLPLCSHAVFSEPGLARYAPAGARLEDQLSYARHQGCAIAAVTLGAEGVIWQDIHGKLHHQPAFHVDVIDTTGAGDVFHGALAFALGAGLTEHAAFRFSAAVAALKCTQPGGRLGIPSLEQALGFLGSHP